MFSIGTGRKQHIFDPRSKLLLVLIASLIALVLTDPLLLSGLLLLVILVLFLVPINRQQAWRTIIPVVKASIPILVVQSLFHEPKGFQLLVMPSQSPLFAGTTLIGWTGLSTGLAIGLRLVIVATTAIIFSSTTDVRDFLQSLLQLRIPFSIAFTTSLTLYFLPLIRQETDEVSMALSTRGLSVNYGSLSQRIRALSMVLTGVFLNFIEKTKWFAIALDSRGFRLYPTRTSLNPVHFTWRDWALFIVISGIIIIFITGELLN